jgi:ADP-heptose:LPS heptosyltransferase
MSNVERDIQSERVLDPRRRRVARLVDAALRVGTAVHSLLRPRRRADGTVRRVLIHASMFLGDSVLALESVRAICHRYPDSCVIVNPMFGDLFRGLRTIEYAPPWLRYDERTAWKELRDFAAFLRRIASVDWDLAVNLTGELRGNLVIYASGALIRVGYANAGGAYFLTNPVPLRAAGQAQRTRDLAEAIGAAPAEFSELAPAAVESETVESVLAQHGIAHDEPLLVIAPSAGYATKRWPAERWRELVERIRCDVAVVLVGEAEEVAGFHPPARIVDLRGRLSLHESGALMQRAQLVVGCDSGATHLAAAFGAETLTLFGPTRPERWRPRGPAPQRVIDRLESCSPCGRLDSCPIDRRCMRRISVTDVEQAIRERVTVAHPVDQSLLRTGGSSAV